MPSCCVTSGRPVRATRRSTGEDEHPVGAEAGGVDERGALADAAAVADGFEVADVSASVPLAASVVDQVVDAELDQPLGLGEVALEPEARARGGVHEELTRDVGG